MKHVLKAGFALASIFTAGLLSSNSVFASTAGWINCANEGGHCTFNHTLVNNKIITMRYGANDKYHYAWARNPKDGDLSCNNGFMGDPIPGTVKKCDYSVYDFYDIANDDVSWEHLCNEGDYCDIPNSDNVRWVRYGKDGRWLYVPVYPNQEIKCHQDQLTNSEDPNRGTRKVCQIARNQAHLSFGKTQDFNLCSTEGSNCDVNTVRPVLVRYGAYNYRKRFYKYTSRVVSTTGPFACNNSFLNENPAKRLVKHCSFMPIPYKTAAGNVPFGEWVAVADNLSTGSRTLSAEIWEGVIETDTHSKSSDWSHSLTLSIEQEGVEFVGGAKVGASTTQTYAHSTSVSSALSKEKRVKATASCTADFDGFYRMWQFRATTSFKNCLTEGICTFTMEPNSTICNSNNSDNPPRCLPGYCTDSDCQSCTYD